MSMFAGGPHSFPVRAASLCVWVYKFLWEDIIKAGSAARP